MNQDHLKLLSLCFLEADGSRCDQGVIARQASKERSLHGVLAGEMLEPSKAAHRTGWNASTASPEQWGDAGRKAETEMSAAAEAGAEMLSVLDDAYPANLRSVRDLPPFLFFRGELAVLSDVRCAAVVGSRSATAAGMEEARRTASGLAEQGVTVVSGLAAGIDTAAHEAALDAGGRTVAVLAAGIASLRTLGGKRRLAERIAEEGGVLVSQFSPSMPAARWSFAARNKITSGLSQAVAVIEAEEKSGTTGTIQAACAQGRHLFFAEMLAGKQEWARRLIDEGKAEAFSAASEIAEVCAAIA